MPSLIGFPTRPRKNPNWLVRLARWIGRQRKLRADYKYFRARGFSRKAAKFNAQNTIQHERH